MNADTDRTNPYADIIDLPRPTPPPGRTPLSPAERAAHFAPFAAVQR